MADGNTAPEVSDPDNQDIVAVSGASAERGPSKAGQGLSALSLPLEGESKWVSVMRALAFATLICIIAIGAVFHFLSGESSFVGNQQLGMMMAGLVFLLILEYFVFLKVVIPRQANYGRYVISADKVDFFPLTALGLGIRKNPQKVRLNMFLGITTSRTADRKGRVSYAVFLVHSTSKGKTIKVRSFPEPAQAEAFAAHLAGLLRLNVASGIARKTKRRAS